MNVNDSKMVAGSSLNFPQPLPQTHPDTIKPSSLLFWSKQTLQTTYIFSSLNILPQHIKSVCVDLSMHLSMTTHYRKYMGMHVAQEAHEVPYVS